MSQDFFSVNFGTSVSELTQLFQGMSNSPLATFRHRHAMFSKHACGELMNIIRNQLDHSHCFILFKTIKLLVT